MTGAEFSGLALSLSTMILPVVIAITIHEAAHGWVAWKLGDDTALRKGRVTFNPIKHVDLIGTIVMPMALFVLSGGKMIFGWAKPVPVDARRLNNPKKDMVLVAAAGPAVNVLMAITAAALFHANEFLPDPVRSWLYWNLGHAVFFNLLIAVFNLLPFPPLDGGRIAVGLLPDRAAYRWSRIEPYGIFLILGLFFLVPFVSNQLGFAINPAYWLLLVPTEFLADMVGKLTFIR